MKIADDRLRTGWRSLFAALSAVVLTTTPAGAAKKYIFASWELGDVSPEEVLLVADKFEATACDGVALYPEMSLRGCDARRRRYVMTDPGFRDEEVAYLEPVLREIVRHPSLRESMLSFNLAPTNRLDWLDESAWRRASENLAVFARLAFGASDADGWREGVALVRIPDGAIDVYCTFDGPKDEKEAKVSFRELEVFRIR